jgi:hypothetical protein
MRDRSPAKGSKIEISALAVVVFQVCPQSIESSHLCYTYKGELMLLLPNEFVETNQLSRASLTWTGCSHEFMIARLDISEIVLEDNLLLNDEPY